MLARFWTSASRTPYTVTLVRAMLIFAVFAGSFGFSRGDEPNAQSPAQPNFEFHNRDTGAALPLISMKSRTQITGPVAVTNIEFVAENTNESQIEAAVTFEVPTGTVLTKFGYFYGSRFIAGEMYDKDEAWKIYSAVTSRGRDPGIMDRPTQTNYHAQIFPVAPKVPLRVRVTLVQMLQTRDKALEFQLPLVQGQAYLGGWNNAPFKVDARVSVATNRADAAITAKGQSQIPALTPETEGKNRVMHFARTFTPRENLTVRVPFENQNNGTLYSGYSCMVGPNEGYYAVTVAAPRRLRNVRARTESDASAGQTLPTAFGDTAPYGDIHLVGRYSVPGMARVKFQSASGANLSVPLYLSPAQTATVTNNPAGALWADKRIAVLQQATRRDFKKDIIRLSQRFMVVSQFTALLAIPQEELTYYRNVLAKQKIQTNTNTMGGGGGDPYIAVHAPADANQVVALFPGGDVKNLVWNETKQVWEGRFDIPFGTPEGAYKVTLIVVHKDGRRNQFVLTYQNRLTGPQISTDSLMRTLVAERGQPVSVSVQGQHIARATVVAPWGARLPLSDAGQGVWQASVPVPQEQATGKTTLTVILLDGAHNPTTITLDMDVR